MRSFFGAIVGAHRRALTEPHEWPEAPRLGANWRFLIWLLLSLGLSFGTLVVLWAAMWGPIVGEHTDVDALLYAQIGVALLAQEALVVVWSVAAAAVLRVPLSGVRWVLFPMLALFAFPWILTLFFAAGCEAGHATGTCISD